MEISFNFTDVNAPNPAIREQHGYLLRNGKHLFSAEFLPQSKPMAGIVFCSPFGEEKIRTIRIYVSFARALAAMGIAAICFDYFGDGDSEGDFEEASFEDRLADIDSVYRQFGDKHSLDKMGLMGLRWGGTLAAIAAENLNPEFLILWEPIIDTQKYFFDHLRINLASQMLIEGKILKNREQLIKELEAGKILTVEGYNLTGGVYFKARDCGLKDRKFDFRGKSLIVQIASNTEKMRPELLGLQQALVGSEITAVPREFEWEKTQTWQPAPPLLFGETIKFLKKNGFLGRNI